MFFCDQLTDSLQFRDDLLDNMMADSNGALLMCNSQVDHSMWWWDTKVGLKCNQVVDGLFTQKKEPTAVAIDLAISSFIG